jgi:cytochrome oxidase Cu insertion factor (SCO1/SenC/PrrC family)/thiol-disulfide isomerase/thioredoxin
MIVSMCAVLTLALVPAPARADGDPASDVLAGQRVFVPADVPSSTAQQRLLEATVDAASRSGYPVRVAVIGSSADLGSITALWRRPQSYAEFLGQELALVAPERVVVAMPNGLALYHPGHALPGEAATLAVRGAPGSGRALLAAATAAVGALAAAAGHPLPHVVVPTGSPNGRRGGSGGLVGWLVFAAGLLVLAAAWTASLRARPLRGRRRPVPTPPVMAFVAAFAAAVLAVGAAATDARADGDPGSDVLVYQNLFAGSDAGLSISQQSGLGDLLTVAERERFPIRVAIIASQSDLGSVTALWHRPQLYARYLGQELALAYQQRLLVVMPGGYGFYWSGHSVAAAYATLGKVSAAAHGAGLYSTALAGVRALASASGVMLPVAPPSAQATPTEGNPESPSGAPSRHTDSTVAFVTAGVALLLAVLLGARAAARRGRIRPPAVRAGIPRLTPGRAIPGLVVLLVAAGAVAVLAAARSGHSGSSARAELAANAYLDPGTPLSGAAPDFTLSDELGRPVALHSFRGKVVLLAFNDAECTTVCPLTTQAMLAAKRMLGRAASRVQLLGINANPASTSLEDVLSYSQLHGLLHDWHFLTGTLPQLRSVWKAYNIEAAILGGQITHTPALFVIDPQGRERKVYLTQQSYAQIGELGKLLAEEVSSLLPGRPPVHSSLGYATVHGISPATPTTLPRVGGGSVTMGAAGAPRLYVFFATWDQEVTSLAGQMLALNRYAADAADGLLPRLVAVDEASVEPSTGAVDRFLSNLPHPLSYPVAIDLSGRVADGYGVQGEPWFVLTSPTGKILWYWEVSTSGWLSRAGLERQVRAALRRLPSAPAGAATPSLAGSPAPLAALHDQAGRLLGAEPALAARIHALRGYPIVVNAWASYCGPCRTEFKLLASSSAAYGRRVAFLGADIEDSAGDAQAFLTAHPVLYPSYGASTSDLQWLAVLQGLPTTIFINSAGKVTYVHTGQYFSQGTLDADIAAYARGG